MFNKTHQSNFDDTNLNTPTLHKNIYTRPQYRTMPPKPTKSDTIYKYSQNSHHTHYKSNKEPDSIFKNIINLCILILLAIVEIGCLYVHYITIDYLKKKKMYWFIVFIMANFVIQFVKGVIKFKKMCNKWLSY